MMRLILIMSLSIPLLTFSCKSPKDSTVEKENKQEQNTTTTSSTTTTTTTTTTSDDGPDDATYDAMAKEMCSCMDEMLGLVDKMKTAEEDQRMEIMQKLQGINQEVEGCIKDLMPKYPSIDFQAQSNPKAEEALLRNCPKYAKMKG